MASGAAHRLMLWLVAFLIVHINGTALEAPNLIEAIAGTGAEREVLAGNALAAATHCEAKVNEEDLQMGLRLGAQFLMTSQREAGNFRYEFDWLTQKETDEDNPVRQSGTLWGLTLLHLDEPERGLLPTIRKGLQYFEKHSVQFPGGLRMVNYPGQEPQKLGSVALLALAHIEVLRKPEVLEGAAERLKLEAHLDGYLRAIMAARTGKNNFYKYYNGSTGKAFGPTSPYYDGESLLAIVKAAKYLGKENFWPHIKASAEAGWRKNVVRGLKIVEGKLPGVTQEKADQAAKRMKGYYQWGTMAWYELTGMKDPEFAKYARRILRYSRWLSRAKTNTDVNTGYAFEGIIPAYVTAVRQGNKKLEQTFACKIRDGVQNLHSLQVGHTKAYGLAEPLQRASDAEKGKDKRAQGGAQGTRSSPGLRIDTTQHQLHALLMAKRLLQQQALI